MSVILLINSCSKDEVVSTPEDIVIIEGDNYFEVAVEGGVVTVDVNPDVSYEVIIPEDSKSWIHQMSSSDTRTSSNVSLGINNLLPKFQIDPNQDYEARESQIIFKSGDTSETVTIWQAGEGALIVANKENLILAVRSKT